MSSEQPPEARIIDVKPLWELTSDIFNKHADLKEVTAMRRELAPVKDQQEAAEKTGHVKH